MTDKRRSERAIDDIVFDVDTVETASSGQLVGRAEVSAAPIRVASGKAVDETLSPVFRQLADPVLPELPREPRGRLLMQSPTRLFFYWSIGTNAYTALNKALGNGTSGYYLALRLLDLTRQTEELHAVETEGSWWFDVLPAAEYRAEIGFYSPSRPFVRVLFSNTVETPRKSPSPRSSSESRWAVTTRGFADILDVSGFEEDAFEVARDRTRDNIASVFASHIGADENIVAAFDIDELRHALSLLAVDTPIADLKWKISDALYAMLEEHLGRLSATAIRDEIGIAEPEYETFTAAGGSLVNIPRRRYRPVSSLDVG